MAHLKKKCTPAMDASVNTIGGGGTVGGAASLSTLTPEMHTVLHNDHSAPQDHCERGWIRTRDPAPELPMSHHNKKLQYTK